jgi:hypothetical protein
MLIGQTTIGVNKISIFTDSPSVFLIKAFLKYAFVQITEGVFFSKLKSNGFTKQVCQLVTHIRKIKL